MLSRFFVNLSHEFRTPLTLILAPLETLLEAAPEQSKEQLLYLMMQRNGRRLLHLINQLLDLSKLEAGKLEVELKPGDVVGLLASLASSFAPLAANRRITFSYCLPEQEQLVYFDSDKLEKIVVNLLSNACKFTPDGGRISLQVTLEPGQHEEVARHALRISVTDDGIGIETDQLDKIFDRFYQTEPAQRQTRESTGIGLALTKELVQLHGGVIEVSSKAGMGTCFTVLLPLEIASSQHLPVAAPLSPADTILANGLAAGHPDALTEGSDNLAKWAQQAELLSEQALLEKNKPILLIVEDNQELADFMALYFQAEYRVIKASDGEIGWAKATETLPDLVISDVMMPNMNGIQLCQQLKADERTSHIPLILLTSKTGQESKLEGLLAGADDYLTKPFSGSELQARVRNLIEVRRRLRERFSQPLVVQPDQIAVTSADEKFLRRTIAIIVDHIEEADFTAEAFEREVGLSHVQFFRKMKALTNQAPGEFLRNYRLQQAAMLLKGKHGNISEVAYSVGFTSLAYFTRCFKAFFKQTPSEYVAAQSS